MRARPGTFPFPRPPQNRRARARLFSRCELGRGIYPGSQGSEWTSNVPAPHSRRQNNKEKLGKARAKNSFLSALAGYGPRTRGKASSARGRCALGEKRRHVGDTSNFTRKGKFTTPAALPFFFFLFLFVAYLQAMCDGCDCLSKTNDS